jgi:alanyl aminopeptidase
LPVRIYSNNKTILNISPQDRGVFVNRIKSISIVFSLWAATTFIVACSEPGQTEIVQAAPGSSPVDQSEPPIARLGRIVVPAHYRLELEIDPRQDRFNGKVEIDLVAIESVSSIWLHGNGLDVTEVLLVDDASNRIGAGYEQKHDSGVALVTLDQAFGPGSATLHFSWSAPFNTLPNGLFRAERGEEAYAATQFQPIAARQVFPGFDEPGFKVPFDISLVTREGDVAITNSPENSAEELGDGTVRRIFETTRPLPTYLLAFAVGPYDLADFGMIPANDVRDRELPLRAIAARGQGENLAYALKHTPGLLTALENYFGTPYPYQKLDLIAVPISFGGAMENAGAITYDESLLLMDEDAALDQRRSYAAVHAHELAHMWFGDLVTPDWWTDIWLNESFASWMMAKAAGEYWPEGEFDRRTLTRALGAMTNDSLASARQIREPVEHNAAIGDAFDGITYQKGGGVLAMLERFTGEEEFQAGIQLHMDRYADGVANAEDFIASVAEGSGRSEIKAAFNSFIEQPGVPLLDVQVNCADGQASTLEVKQARYAPLGSAIDPQASQWLVPMCVSYEDGGVKKSECTMLRESQQTIPLDSAECPTQLHPNADGAGYYRFAMEESWWQGLVAGVDAMQPAEALVVADSLDAAFRAGSVSARTYVAGMAEMVNHDAWDVVEAGIDQLEGIIEIVAPGELGQVEAALGELAKPRFARLAEDSADSAELLNSRLQRFLMVVAKDTDLRAPLAERAAQRIGLDGEADPTVVTPAELETVLSIGVQDLGEPFFSLLLEQALASEDRAFRNDALGALARVEDPALVAELQTVMLSGELQGYEPVFMLFRQMARTATTELTYVWLLENYEAVAELAPAEFRGGFIASLGSSFCNADRADEWVSFVEARAEELPGYERSLAQATETVRLCAALREAKAAELIASLEILGSESSARVK